MQRTCTSHILSLEKLQTLGKGLSHSCSQRLLEIKPSMWIQGFTASTKCVSSRTCAALTHGRPKSLCSSHHLSAICRQHWGLEPPLRHPHYTCFVHLSSGLPDTTSLRRERARAGDATHCSTGSPGTTTPGAHELGSVSDRHSSTAPRPTCRCSAGTGR